MGGSNGMQFFGDYTGRFLIFQVIINIHNKKTKGPTLMEFSQLGKTESF
jgi:hypothetical protein